MQCPKQVTVPTRKRDHVNGTPLYKFVACQNKASVPVHWGPERTMVCVSCANELTRDDYLILVCRLPNDQDILPLTPADRAEARELITRIARGVVPIVETDRGMTAVIHHWGRQSIALEALRKRGFQCLQLSDNPTVRIVARRQEVA